MGIGIIRSGDVSQGNGTEVGTIRFSLGHGFDLGLTLHTWGLRLMLGFYHFCFRWGR